jgi:hypothetical protein
VTHICVTHSAQRTAPKGAMMTDHATEKRLEAIARRLSQEQRGTDAYWELYLPDAYERWFKTGAHRT